jgi:signal transduction histidine kinase
MSDTQLQTFFSDRETDPEDTAPAWVPVSAASDLDDVDAAPVSTRRVLGTIAAGTLVVLLLVGFSGSLAASRLAERESVHDAAKSTSQLAESVVQPVLSDGLLTGDAAAVAAMDAAIRDHVLGPSNVRVKIWTPDGRIVYSDESRLVGRQYPLGEDERDVFTHPVTRAEISDLQRPENFLERGQGKLLEVYRPVWTPRGVPLLFETYAPYDDVTSRAGQLWRGFAGITVTSLLALILLLVPVVWRLLGRVRRSQLQRETLLRRAVDASSDERRRIAGTLHDGVVQELAAASLIVSVAAERATVVGQPALADQLREAASTVRAGIGSMRSLLVDIYPPNLATAGLLVALEDLTTGLHSREVDVTLDLSGDAADALGREQQRLVYRVAHECLLNTMRHSAAHHVMVTLRWEGDAVVLGLEDDGVGFDAAQVLAQPAEGHFGLRVLGDVAGDAGALLEVSTAPGRGTRWRLEVPLAGAPGSAP